MSINNSLFFLMNFTDFFSMRLALSLQIAFELYSQFIFVVDELSLEAFAFSDLIIDHFIKTDIFLLESTFELLIVIVELA